MKTALKWGTRSSYGLDALMGRQVGQGPGRRTGKQMSRGTLVWRSGGPERFLKRILEREGDV